ncbi:MAG: hypothetical protein RL198_256 [Actinomycetota bacterium]
MRVVVGVTGGIAAYKSLSLIRELRRLGHEVRVIATESAFRFVGKDSLAALSENHVETELFSDVQEVKHIEMARWADLVIVAPATASFISRLANGSAWDLLDNVVLAASSPILVAPAMHTEMWENPATIANVQLIQERGITVLQPDSGWLSSGDFGSGRLPEPESIAAAALALLIPRDLEGVEVLVTAGGTIEEIDAVRFIGNHSSGRTGLAIASELHRRGANVELLACNISGGLNFGFQITAVRTSAELAAALDLRRSVRVLVMAAAVSDFTLQRSDSKIPRGKAPLTLELQPTPDLLADYVANNPECVAVGFTLEERSKLKESALRKLHSKGVALMVANDLGSLGGEKTQGFLLGRDYEIDFACSKEQLAMLLVDEISKQLAVPGQA